MDDMEQTQVEEKAEVSPKKKNGMATASLVLGIIGVITGIIAIGSLLGILAVIFGIIAIVRASKNPEIGGKTKAIVGIVLGAIAILMIFVSFMLAALAIPRFMAASKKSKVSVARMTLKRIYVASETFYQENGIYPPVHQFNDASTKNSKWDNMGLFVDKPTEYPRFTYRITIGGSDGFEASADASNSYDSSVRDVSKIVINRQGVLTGGTW